MTLKQCVSISVASTICLLITQKANAETFPSGVITNIPRLNDIERPKTSIKDWLAQESETSKIQQITGVKLQETETRLEVVLETTTGELSAPNTLIDGNILIADIPNAVLALPNQKEISRVC